MRLRRIFFITLALALIASAIIFRAQLLAFGHEAWDAASEFVAQVDNRQSEIDNRLVASGMIEARTLDIASPTGGRIAALYAAEGQPVAAEDLIAELDTNALDAQIAEAQAAVAVAQAQVALLRAGARPVDLAVARAGVGQAEAARDAAHTAWQDALALVDAPDELDVQIAQASATLQVTTEQAAAAEAAAVAADLEQQLWGRIVQALAQGFDAPIPGGGTTHIATPPERRAYANLQWNLASQQAWEAHAKQAAALAARDAARQALADLQQQRAEPLTLQAQADTAEAAQAVAEAAVTTAQAGVAVLDAGVPAEQIAAIEAAVTQAQAAVAALETQKIQARLVAPQAGIVTAVIMHAGEVVAPAAAIVRLADRSEVTLTVYVPEPRLGEIKLGQTAYVRVDSFPDRTFAGQVTHIAGRAEFTPKNVQTREERATTVFAVKITIPNPEAVLKPGMPADATFDAAAPETGGRSLLRTDDQPVRGASPEAPTASAAARYTGVIEATEVRVSAEIGGRVSQTHATEGDGVTAGQVLAELDGENLAARRVQAEAALAAAEADLARVAAAPQPARIAQAAAGVKQAQAALAAAEAALAAAQTVRDQPQALDAQINAGRAHLRTPAAAVDSAQAGLKAAQVLQESLPAPASDEDRTRRAVYDQNVIAAEALVRAAQAQERGARATLAQLLAIRQQPIAAEAAVHRAEGEVAAAQAALVTAQAVLEQTRAPAQPEAVAVAAARVVQAQAALKTLEVMAAKLVIRSPITGTLAVQAIHAGEVAQPTATLFTVIDLRRVKLVIYVPTGEIGRVRLGQAVEVVVDAYPERSFSGRVIRIADQAEFTPKNVQTEEERVKTVFAVEVELENAEELLRPGMPADAVLR